MKITMVGVGNAGTTLAADLTHKGHEVTLLKTSKATLHDEHYRLISKTKQIEVYDFNAHYIEKIYDVTEDYAKALSNAEVIIIYIQTNYHEDVIKKMIPYLHDGQTVIMEPGYLSTCFFLKYNCPDLVLIEAESSPIDCRIVSPGVVKVLFKNVMNPFGVYPKKQKNKACEILDQLKYPYELTENVVEAALHNPNLIVHTIGAIFSIPRIEYSKGDYWMYREVFTPHVWNVVESLDREKMDVLEKMGCIRVPYVEACRNRNAFDKSKDAKAVFFDYAQNSSPSGPSVPDSRYITEDVPQGLVLLESLGKVLGVETPTCTGLIQCASAALNRDFRVEGRKVERLSIENIKKILQDS